MPYWTFIALWTLWIIWALDELWVLHLLVTRPRAYRKLVGQLSWMAFLVLSPIWISWNIWG